MTTPAESFALQLRLHRQGVAPIQYAHAGPVVGGGSDVQAKRADVPPKQRQQSSSKSAAASLADAKEAKQTAELKSYSRRSARVQAKKAQSKPESGHDQHAEQQKGGGSMDLFATTDQVRHQDKAQQMSKTMCIFVCAVYWRTADD